jgi:ABC-type phosphate/phosphonate transport system substrate-binding protein
MRSLRLFQRSATIPKINTTTTTKTPPAVKTAITAGLLWKKDVPPVAV